MKSIGLFTVIGCFCICASCSNELRQMEETVRSDEHASVGEGKVIVDYSLGETASRAGDGLEANRRISSLVYLLYGEDGYLLKQRQISDINEGTVWPLVRETMTWAQRQELKDTLDLGQTYTAVFIANCPLFDETGEITEPLLKNKRSLSDAYLTLPSDGFKENTMYYVAGNEINPSGEGAVNRDNPYNCSIVLQRVVTRTDIELVEWGTEANAFGNFLGNRIKEENGLLSHVLEEYAKEALAKSMEQLGEEISGKVTETVYLAAITELKKRLAGIPEKVLEEEYIKEVVYNRLLEDCQKNPSLMAQCADWTNDYTATVSYESTTYSNQFGIMDWKYGGSASEPVSVVAGLSSGKITIIGFGSNVDDSRNEITGLVLSKSASEPLTFTFSSAFETKQTGNTLKTLVCDPIAVIDYSSEASGIEKPLVVEVDMDSYVDLETCGALGENDRSAFISAVKDAIDSEDGSWERFGLRISIPDMSVENNIVLTPSLSEKQ